VLVRSYSDDELARAVASAHSWRGVLRALGLSDTSAGSARSVRRHADRMGLSYVHFTGQRRWSDAALTQAVAEAQTWSQVASTLGLVPEGGTLNSLRAHAHRLGLDTEQLRRRAGPQPSGTVFDTQYRPECLREAGSMFAATCFALRGARVAWPLEPCRYDLLVDIGGESNRVQVKTTMKHGPKAMLMVSSSRRRGRTVYAPGEIDSIFAIDAELTGYWIPFDLVAGYTQIQLSRYVNYTVVDRGRLIPG
jgi:PD-(D/E)XK nuclease superfamily protein